MAYQQYINVMVNAVIRNSDGEITSMIVGRDCNHPSMKFTRGWARAKYDTNKSIIMHFPQGVFRSRQELTWAIKFCLGLVINKRI